MWDHSNHSQVGKEEEKEAAQEHKRKTEEK